MNCQNCDITFDAWMLQFVLPQNAEAYMDGTYNGERLCFLCYNAEAPITEEE